MCEKWPEVISHVRDHGRSSLLQDRWLEIVTNVWEMTRGYHHRVRDDQRSYCVKDDQRLSLKLLWKMTRGPVWGVTRSNPYCVRGGQTQTLPCDRGPKLITTVWEMTRVYHYCVRDDQRYSTRQTFWYIVMLIPSIPDSDWTQVNADCILIRWPEVN